MTPKQLKQAAAVMLAAAELKPIEWRDKGSERWRVVPVPSFDWVDFNYRVAVTKPSINWDHVHPDVVAIATDKSNFTLAFFSMPKIRGEWWVTEFSEPAYSVNAFASFVLGTCDWEDSLVVRPGVE